MESRPPEQLPDSDPIREYMNQHVRALEQTSPRAERTEVIKSLRGVFDRADILLAGSEQQDAPFTDQLTSFTDYLLKYRRNLADDNATLPARTALWRTADTLQHTAGLIQSERGARTEDTRDTLQTDGVARLAELEQAPSRRAVQTHGDELTEVFRRGQRRAGSTADFMHDQRRAAANFVRELDRHEPDLPADVHYVAYQRSAAIDAANREVDERDGILIDRMADLESELRTRLVTVAELTLPDEPTAEI